MKPKNTILKIAAMLLMIAGFTVLKAQTKYTVKDNLTLSVNGTSTMHDWTMKSTKGECNATFTLSTTGAITGLTAMTFTTPAEALKSEKSGMDKNAYKALKTTAHPTITYNLVSATVNADGTVNCKGTLTIAGTTVATDLVANCKPNANGSIITVIGSKKISMKDYKVDPPSFMMGTIKTGNDITLNFSFNLKK